MWPSDRSQERHEQYFSKNPDTFLGPTVGCCGLEETEFQPELKGHLPTEIIVLTGPLCVSSCDLFAAAISDNNLGRIVGMPSAGADSPIRMMVPFRFANGEVAQMTITTAASQRGDASGIIEGNPPKLDLPFYPIGKPATYFARLWDALDKI